MLRADCQNNIQGAGTNASCVNPNSLRPPPNLLNPSCFDPRLLKKEVCRRRRKSKRCSKDDDIGYDSEPYNLIAAPENTPPLEILKEAMNGCVPGIRIVRNPERRRIPVSVWTHKELVTSQNQSGNTTRIGVNAELLGPRGITIFGNVLHVVTIWTHKILSFNRIDGSQSINPIECQSTIHDSAFPFGLISNECGGFQNNSILAGISGISNQSSELIVCTKTGAIIGTNITGNGTNSKMAHVFVNMKTSGETHVYTGLASANRMLYVADFFNHRIDVFNDKFVPPPPTFIKDEFGNDVLAYTFEDKLGSIPPLKIDTNNFAPHNIVVIGNFLYILWARVHQSFKLIPIAGPGEGYISEYTLMGVFVRRFAGGGPVNPLNVPWAMVEAPWECGIPKCSKLVGNHGDGRILIFDNNGTWLGALRNPALQDIIIDGLWGLTTWYQDFNRCAGEFDSRWKIYYTASNEDNRDGTVGIITLRDVAEI